MATVSQNVELDSALQRGLEERPSTIDPQTHDAIVKRVMAMYKACKQEQLNAPEPYQPGGEWKNYLAERNAFYDLIINDEFDAASEKLRGFWRNELGPIVKEYAKYEQLTGRESEYIERFQRNIQRNYQVWKEIFRCEDSVLDVPTVGNPWGYFFGEQLVVPKACRFHALSQQIISLTSDVEQPLVAEVGAGYGGQAYYLLRDRANLTYVDFDLPETLVFAAYYLLACLPDRSILLFGEEPTPTIGTAWRGYDAILMPNFELPRLADNSVDLCLNSFSFSEMPMETLKEYINHVQRSSCGYLLHNNMDRKGVVNRGFERIPASEYPIDIDAMKLIYKKFDLFHGHDGDYREFLYQKRI